MRDPVIVPAPVLHPGRCAGCGTHKGPMIDTAVDFDLGTRLYVCVDVCLDTWAKKVGYLPPAAALVLEEQVTDAAGKLVEAQQAFEARERDEMSLIEAVATRAVQKAFEDPPAGEPEADAA